LTSCSLFFTSFLLSLPFPPFLSISALSETRGCSPPILIPYYPIFLRLYRTKKS
jgi:hypothetical protein